MRILSKRAVFGLLFVCALFTTMVIGVGVAGIAGVRSTAGVSAGIVTDQLDTSTATAQFGRTADAAHALGDELYLSTDPANVAHIERRLVDVTIPAADTALANLEQRHANDDPVELTQVRTLVDQWAKVRLLLRPVGQARPAPIRDQRLDVAYRPLSAHVNHLLGVETINGGEGQLLASSTSTRTTRVVVGAVLLSLLVALAITWAGIRKIRQAVEPENDQIEFAETLQVTDSEQETHELLKSHLERSMPGSDATILNCNNSADRLEAMTALAPNSPLASTLQHADPRACLAIRATRPYLHDKDRKPLLTCRVCGDCPGSSSCTPLTVSGEVIGAVLVTSRPKRNDEDERRIRDSVSQAAPVLANLRNLAIAEVRAATDALSGLPNKRAVGDTMKRMLAHASRSLSPLALVMVDLDHFKNINDTLGHPVGDQALASVGAALRSVLRASDFAGRNGGEEFAVLLPDTGIDAAMTAAEKIRLAIAGIDIPGTGLELTASLGVAVYPDHAMNVERLERLADAALYTAKRSGRNRVEIADVTTADPVEDTATLAGAISG
jgi:diguanylate cyclase (GGDEF)-like protein